MAFLNPEMARSKGLGEDHLLFGAYPRERAAEVEEGLRGALESYRGRVLAAAEAYRVWGERFFPSVPSQPIPKIIRGFVSVAEFLEVLGSAQEHSVGLAVQSTVAQSRERYYF